MMQTYLLYCSNNPCGSAVGQYTNDRTKYTYTKPEGIDLNAAFILKMKEDGVHCLGYRCMCEFEVVEK